MAMRSTGRRWRRRSRSRSTKSWQRPTKEVRNPPQRRGLRKLSSDFIGKARDETATQVTRIGLTFLGTTAFCLLSLLSPGLMGANLSRAENLTQEQLDQACGNEDTKLPGGLTLKAMCD